MTQHFKFGGSTAARLIGCPANLRLIAEAPTSVNVSNPAADLGTMLHDVMEEIYGESELLPAAIIAQGREYKGQKLTQELVDEKIIPAMVCVDELMDSHDISNWKVEPLVKIAEDIGGSIDLIGISEDAKTVLVLDYKFGFNPVEIIGNKQLQFYALAAATDPQTRDWFDAADQIVLAIVQPNDNGEDVDTWVIDMNGLDTFETAYLRAVEDSEKPDAQPVSGDWCKYCDAHATCPVKTGLALKATRVNEITAEKLADYLPLADEVIAWSKEVQKMAYAQMELGVEIKGYKLVNKRASRVWTDRDAVEDKIRKARKIKLEQGFDLKLKSPAQFEKVCKDLAVDFEAYGQYISSVSSGTTIAKENDKRQRALPLAGLAQLNAMNT